MGLSVCLCVPLPVSLALIFAQNFIRFQSMVSEHYDSMVEEFGFEVIDASAPIEIQHSEVVCAPLSLSAFIPRLSRLFFIGGLVVCLCLVV